MDDIVAVIAEVSRVLRPPDLHDWHRFIGSRDPRDLARRNGMVVRGVQGVSVRVRDVPAAIRAMVELRRNRISYAEAGSRVRLCLSRSQAVAYIGYALRTDSESSRDHPPDVCRRR